MSELQEREWSVYLLYNRKTRRSYLGCTTDPDRRLRQHNGEIRGGARATQAGAGGWEMVCYVSGFGKKDAYRWERIVKCRRRGWFKRYRALVELATGLCPSGGRHYSPPEGLAIVATIVVRMPASE